ncbi:TPA: AAA family ATPase [Vibrio vulnificus]|nr:AAA family ATPase [Vibrio vulnificus]
MSDFVHSFSLDSVLNNHLQEFPLLAEFESTVQDSRWHSEGNVKIHTDLVIQEMKKLILKNPQLSESEQKILLWSAALHDYAKPITTHEREINGEIRVVAPKHEQIGASLLFSCKKPHELTYEEWLVIIKLVGFHQQAKLLVIRNEDYRSYIRLFREVKSLDLLYYLAMADILGRDCEDKQEQLDYVEFFKLNYLDYNLGGYFKDYELKQKEKVAKLIHKPSQNPEHISIRGISNIIDGNIYMIEESLSKPYAHMGYPIVDVLVGVASSGKSTYTKTVPERPVISMDNIRARFKNIDSQDVNNEVLRIALEELKDHLRSGNHVIWDATNYRYDFRSKVTELAFKYKAYVRFFVFIKDKAQLHIDNKSRKKRVIPEVIENQCSKFELPIEDEAHKVNWLHNGVLIDV